MNVVRKFKFEILIFLFFVFARLPYLGHDTFNTDVWKWKARSFDFSTGIFTLDFAKTLQKYHPGVTLMWCGTVAIKVANQIFDHTKGLSTLDQLFILDTLQKLSVVLVIGLTFAFSFYALRNTVGLPKAIFLMLFVSLEPFYIALTREFHLEGLLATFMLASALWLYYFFEDVGQRKRLYISGVFTGLALLTKTSAVYSILFTGLILIIRLVTTRNYKAELRWFTQYFGVCLITFALLWPAIWVNPVHTFSELVRGVVEVGVDTEHIQYYFGKLVGDPGPSYYLVVLALRSSVLLFSGLFGLVFLFRKLDDRSKKFVWFFTLYSVFYLIEITILTKKLDRYILPGFVSLGLLAGIFWMELIAKSKFSRSVGFIAIFGLLILTNGVVFPDFLSYYNPMFGGLRTGIKVLEPKWLIGEPPLAAYFKNIKQRDNYQSSGPEDSFEEIIYRNPTKNVLSVGFQEKYYTQIWPFFREFGAWAVIQDLTPFAVKTRYFVYPVWDDQSGQENRFKLKYVDAVKERGVPLYKVYERID